MKTFLKLGGCSCLVWAGLILANGPIMPVLGIPLVLAGVLAALIF